MKNSAKKITFLVVAIQIVTASAFVPMSASAHYISVGANYELLGGVGAAGHDHAPAPVADGVGDGHTDHSHAQGGSSILKPGTGPWWGVMMTSLTLMALLSVGVWKYLQVPPVKLTSEAKNEEKPVA